MRPRWVRDFGDAAIAEAERLYAERHDEYTRETAVLTIQDAWRRRKAPALADNQKLPFVPGPTYLEAEAASRIQSAVRGKLTRLALAAELELMEELGSPSPRWTGPLADLEEADTFADVCAAGTKLVLVVGAGECPAAAVARCRLAVLTLATPAFVRSPRRRCRGLLRGIQPLLLESRTPAGGEPYRSNESVHAAPACINVTPITKRVPPTPQSSTSTAASILMNSENDSAPFSSLSNLA